MVMGRDRSVQVEGDGAWSGARHAVEDRRAKVPCTQRAKSPFRNCQPSWGCRELVCVCVCWSPFPRTPGLFLLFSR